MRGLVLPVALLASVVAPSALAASGPKLTASPNPVKFGHQLTITGKHWPVIEFCTPRVRLSLRSAQNRVFIGRENIRPSGRFRRHFTPLRSKIGAGSWKLVAIQHCESGSDGSPNPVRRSLTLRIR
jgi:hypothetical protein